MAEELKKIEELEEQVNLALKRSRQLEDTQKFDEDFFKQELREMQERCFQNQQTMMRIEQKSQLNQLNQQNLKNSDITHKESPLHKSEIKQRGILEQKNAQIVNLQRKLLDQERVYNQKFNEQDMRIKQLEGELDEFKQGEKGLEELQKQYLELQEKMQETMRVDSQDYQQLKQEYEEYQILTQNIVNQEEEYQRRICELEEELQQAHAFQDEFMERLRQNEDVFQQRYRELKNKYQQQLEDQRRVLDQQIDELREQNNTLFSQLQSYECRVELSSHNKTENDISVSRCKSYSAYNGVKQQQQQQQSVLQNKSQNYAGSYLYNKQKMSNNKPIKQINISIDKENDQSYSKTRSYSKELQPMTYKQVAEQRQAILYKIPRGKK